MDRDGWNQRDDTTNVAEGYGGPQDLDVLFAADGEHVAIDALLVARRPPG